MAEQLKEYVNTTLTISDFSADSDYTIIANNSTTQAVVKDIQSTPKGTMTNSNIAISNGASTILTGGGATGFELVPQSGTLKLKLTPVPDAGSLQAMTIISYPAGGATYSTTAIKIESTKANYSTKSGSTYTSGTSASVTSDIITMSGLAWMVPSADGSKAWAFFYDGNSTTYLRWAPRDSNSGNITGGWNNVSTDSYNYATYDVATNKCYIARTSNVLRQWDMNTGIQSNLTTILFQGIAGDTNPSSYCHSFVHNGYFFCQKTSSFTDRVFYYHLATGIQGRINGTFYATSNGLLSVTYNSEEKRWYIITKSGSATLCSYVDGAALSGNPTAIAAGTTGSNGYYVATAGGAQDIYSSTRWMDSANGHFIWADVSSSRFATIGKPSITGMATILKTDKILIDNLGPTFMSVGDVTATPLTELDIELDLKVSGVEITGV